MDATAKKANRVRATREIGPMADAYWEQCRREAEAGKMVSWWFGYPAFQLLQAIDVVYVHGQGLAAKLAARKEEQEARSIAEAEGYLPELCSYCRSSAGVGLIVAKGSHGSGPKPGWLVPKPDFTVTINPCSTEQHWCDDIARRFNVPAFHIELPYFWNESEADEYVSFTTQQFRDFIPFLEDVTKRRYNWERLKTILAELKKTAEVRNQGRWLSKNIPSPASFFDWVISLAGIVTPLPSPGPREYFKRIKSELETRVAGKVGAVPNERFRVYWDGFVVWNRVGTLAEKFAALDTCVVLGKYSHVGIWEESERLHPDRPLESLADIIVRERVNRTAEWHIDRITQLCREYSIDGIIAHVSQTCRVMAFPQFEILEEVSRRLGIPATFFEADLSDANFYNDAEVNAKIEALVDLKAARKANR